MRTVDKKNVTAVELREDLEIDVFHFFLDYPVQPGKDPLENFLRIGFDADESRGIVFLGSLAQKYRGQSAANLDDQQRLKMADQGVSDQRVSTIRGTVIE